jgi:hypothetical protein
LSSYSIGKKGEGTGDKEANDRWSGINRKERKGSKKEGNGMKEAKGRAARAKAGGI